MTENATTGVTVKLGEDDVVLAPSANAAALISRQFGGFNAAFEAVGRFDIDALAFIVALGSGGKTDVAGLKAMTGRVYDAGIVSLVPPVAQYLRILLSGGRDQADTVTG